jgi:hypothetical protein
VKFLPAILLVASQAASAAPVKMEFQASNLIRVRVYNVAHLENALLTRATNVATKVFRQAGLEIQWLDCTLNFPSVERSASCDASFAPTDLALAIQSEFGPGLEKVVGRNTMGYAMQPGNGQFGHNAAISLQRVRWLAKAAEIPEEKILGLALAHEIGHLLLGSNRHSAAGLMSSAWSQRGLLEAATENLRFLPAEAKEMREAAQARTNRARMQAASVTQSKARD